MKDQENIIARARRGDAGAFEQLVETYREQVYRIALRMCGNAADADEAAQEAFLAAWKGLPNFRGDSRFSTWLYQLTTHAAIDLMRRARPRARTPAAGRAAGDPGGGAGRYPAADAGVPADRGAALSGGSQL